MMERAGADGERGAMRTYTVMWLVCAAAAVARAGEPRPAEEPEGLASVAQVVSFLHEGRYAERGPWI